MKIFLWKSYGDMDVYAFDTPERQESVRKLLIPCLNGEGSDLSLDATWKEIYRAIADHKDSGSDMFEYGTGLSHLLYIDEEKCEIR